jgi:protease IV
MSCNADWIVAQPGTLTGSIGVFGGKFNLAGTYDKIGVHTHDFKRGELSDLLSVNKPFSDKGREAFKAYLADFYGEFVGRVATGRHLDPAKVEEVAQGRVWTGQQALDRGLVDQLGGLDDALAKAADLGKLQTWGIEDWPKQKTFFELLVEQMSEGNTTAPKLQVDLAPDLPGASDALKEALRINAMARDNGVLAYLPAKIRIE